MLRSVLGVAVVCAAVFLSAPSASASDQCPVVTKPSGVAEGRIPPADQLACADLRGLEFIQKNLAGADLHGSNLSGVMLMQADLTGANLRGANLTGAHLAQAELISADLRGANLSDAKLNQADLSRADLRGAVTSGALLIQADLRGANLRGTDLSGATLIQATTEGAPAPPTTTTTVPVLGETADVPPAESRIEPSAAAPTAPAQEQSETQLAWILFWPAVAIAVAWWRVRFGHLLRHRVTTPVRPVDLTTTGLGVALVVAGLYLVPVGVTRGLAHLAGGAGWATDPGPLGSLATEPHWQLVNAAGALVLGGIVLLLARRRPPRRPASTVGRVAIGQPTPVRLVPDFSRSVRLVAMVTVVAGVLDLVVVVVLLMIGQLPDSGPWRHGTVIGHLGFVVIAVLLLFRLSARAGSGTRVETPSGAVVVGGVRDPFLWLSGKDSDDQPVSQALPWESLEHVHLIRVLGTPHPTSTMLTIRHPGADHASEYPNEMRVSPEQVAGLRANLPPEMFTEHTRAPSSN